MDSFVHCHVHTEYSMLDGAAKIEALFAEAARLGQPAVAMTDHGNMFGAYQFHQVAQRVGVKPIIGIEAYLAPSARTLREPVRWGIPEQAGLDVGGNGAHTHLTLLALDATGLRNLFRLSSLASMEGFYRKPRVDRELLAQHSEGILATTGCLGGEVATRLRLGQEHEALQAAAEMRDIFGPDNYFLEVMDHGIDDERALRPALMRLRDQLGLPVLATNDSHYVTPDQASAHDALLCVQTHAKLASTDRFRFDGEGYHLKSAAEMRAYWDAEIPGACDATLQVAQRVGDYSEVFAHADRMPRFPVPDGETAETWLAKETARGLARRWPGGVPADRQARADYELGVISASGFPGYMLTVADLCNFARDRSIRFNARGSAAGSIVSYALGITEVDPVHYDLLFERFLNPDRLAPPDIDLDVDERRRGELVHYLSERWGTDRVGQISNFSVIKARAAVRDAARLLDFPYSLGDRMSKALPQSIQGFDVPLTAVTDPEHPRHSETAEFRALLADDHDAQAVLGTARGLEGLIRQAGVHAAGVLLSAEPLIDVLPLRRHDDGSIIAGWDWITCCDEMGLLKVDLLGLRNLTIVDDTLLHLRERGTDLDLATVAFDDPATFALLARGATLGVFQLDSGPLRDLLRRIAPTRFEDIAAALALYRPGPMGAGAHTEYADRKNRRKPVRPIHPELQEALDPILGGTYHLLVYQEQVVQVAVALAGYTAGQGDLLRKAMGKKKPEILAREHERFAAGMVTNGYSPEAATALWDTMVPFAGYGFNRAHATSYGRVSYWTAYLKANHPTEYMAAVLTSVGDDKDRMALYLAEARDMGLCVLVPDVNTSSHHFSPTPDGIRFGLDAVRNVGAGVVDAILAAREDGPFTDVPDFLLRSGVGKRALEGLIQAGALDTLGATRRSVWDARDVALGAAGAVRKQRDLGQFDLFGDDLGIPADDAPAAGLAVPFGPGEWPRDEMLTRERDVLGLYVSSHPLSGVARILAEHRDATVAELTAEQPDTHGGDDRERTVRICGLFTAMTPKTNREGKRWALLTVEDLTGAIEVCVFPRQYGRVADQLFLDEIVTVTGRLNRRDDRVSLIAHDAATITAVPDTSAIPVVLLDVPGTPGQHEIDRLATVLAAHPGAHPVWLRTECGAVLELTGHTVAPSPEFERAAAAVLGNAP